MRALLVLALCSSCTLGYNATHAHSHMSEADLATESMRLRYAGHIAMANRLEREEHEKQQAPMWCMFGDMGAMLGGFGALSAAQSAERYGMIEHSSVEPLNLAGLATTAVVFVSLGVSLWRYGHL